MYNDTIKFRCEIESKGFNYFKGVTLEGITRFFFLKGSFLKNDSVTYFLDTLCTRASERSIKIKRLVTGLKFRIQWAS